MNDLKPCPFCASIAYFFTVNDEESGDFGGQGVVCTNCGASIGLKFACGEDPKPELAESWNQRATAQGELFKEAIRQAHAVCLKGVKWSPEPTKREQFYINGTCHRLAAEISHLAAPTKGADARPVAIYQISPALHSGMWIDTDAEHYADYLDDYRRIVYATRDASPLVDARPVASEIHTVALSIFQSSLDPDTIKAAERIMDLATRAASVIVNSLLDEAFEILRPDSPEDCPEEPHMRVALGKKYWSILTAAPRSIESQPLPGVPK